MVVLTWHSIRRLRATSQMVPLVALVVLLLVTIVPIRAQQQTPQQQQPPPPQQQQQQPPPQQQQQQQPPPPQQQPPPPQQQQQQQQPPPPPQQQQQQLPQQQQQQPPPPQQQLQQQPPPPQQQLQQQPPPPQQQPPPPPLQQQQQPPPQQQQQFQQPPQQQQFQQPPPQQQQFQQPPPQQQQQFQQPPPNQQQQQFQQPPPHQQQQQFQQPPPQHFQQQPPPLQQQQHFQQPPPMVPQLQHQPPPQQYVPVEAQTQSYYESLPAVAMDYKVHIDAGKEDCYWQFVKPGSTFFVSFQVIRGGDGMAGFAVRHPSGAIVHPYQWQASADYTDQASTGGYYAVCIDNQFSRFAGKLVNLYITVIKYDEWDQFSKEIEELQLNMNNFTQSIGTVERNINTMLQFQSHRRNMEARDIAQLLDNNSYVQNWSLTQILVIFLTTTIQVYFVRKLFDIKSDKTGRSRI